ncbi:MAG TPA: hypothetical protein VH598_09300 [Verrucomicrobiae bacterium]|nr:hypothetical protein [Verrucomicrobiae bacterium]
MESQFCLCARRSPRLRNVAVVEAGTEAGVVAAGFTAVAAVGDFTGEEVVADRA